MAIMYFWWANSCKLTKPMMLDQSKRKWLKWYRTSWIGKHKKQRSIQASTPTPFMAHAVRDWLISLPPRMTQQPPSGPGPPHYRGYMITLRHTTLDRTPLDQLSARRRNLYLNSHNTDKRRTFMPPAEFEPAIPTSERPQTHTLERAASGIDLTV